MCSSDLYNVTYTIGLTPRVQSSAYEYTRARVAGERTLVLFSPHGTSMLIQIENTNKNAKYRLARNSIIGIVNLLRQMTCSSLSNVRTYSYMTSAGGEIHQPDLGALTERYHSTAPVHPTAMGKDSGMLGEGRKNRFHEHLNQRNASSV